jgi:DNA-3-methyladenine glycosylase
MYGPPGHAYVYLIYGMHHCLNIVTEQEGFPAAVLIRALEPLEGIERMRELRGERQDLPLTSGPARLCQAMSIDRQLDSADLCTPDARLFLERDAAIPRDAIATSPRIGVRGDDMAVSIPWRFFVRNNRYISH